MSGHVLSIVKAHIAVLLIAVTTVVSAGQPGTFVKVNISADTWVEATEQRIIFVFPQHEAEHEQHLWHFYLGGVRLESIMPQSWTIQRENNSLQLIISQQVNFEVLSRSGSYLTVEKVTRGEESDAYQTLTFETGVQWLADDNYTCSIETQGDECGECNSEIGARRADGLAGVCRYEFYKKVGQSYFRRYVIPLIFGVVVLLAMAAALALIAVSVTRPSKIRRKLLKEARLEQKVTKERPSWFKTKETPKGPEFSMFNSATRIENSPVGQSSPLPVASDNHLKKENLVSDAPSSAKVPNNSGIRFSGA